ncbi:MAG: response regulator [Verrucomicrobiales bacterium]|nr:response regulator [Verrucomicrobiales bacterium]
MTAPTILIVEDESIVALDLAQSLESLGFKPCGTADNAEAAIAKADRLRPDLVLMDINLRGVEDGISAARKIHEAFFIPVVFLTAHSDPATLRRAREALPYGYLVKPYEDHGLRATLETALYRHQAAVKQRQIEQWLTSTLFALGEAVISVDLDGRIRFLNPAAERLTGWIRSEAADRPHAEILRLQRESDAHPEDPVRAAMDSGLVIKLDADLVLVTRDNRRVAVHYTASPTRDEAGRVNGVAVLLREPSSAARTEAERAATERRLQESHRLESLGALAGGIAHEFNNLLIGILGYNALIAEEIPADSPAHTYVRQVETAGHRAAGLCKQMLTYAGKSRSVFTALSLAGVAADTLKLTRLFFTRSTRLELNLSEALPPVLADASQIQQVLLNLISNASEALGSEGGLITVSTGTATLTELPDPGTHAVIPSPPGSYAYLEVADTGCGMTPDILARIFDPFFTTKFTGRGLGLAAVLGIVRAHRGGLQVRSTPGQGSAFRILLPFAPAELLTAPAKETAPAHPSLPAIVTVLVVESEQPVRDVAARFLRSLGFNTLEVDSGTESLRRLKAADRPIHAVLLDATMEGLNSVETLRAIRQLQPDLPVVLMSGFSEETASERFAEFWPCGFVQKPFTAGTLGVALQRALAAASPG